MNWLIFSIALFFSIFQQSVDAWANKFNPDLNKVLRKFNIPIMILFFVIWWGIVHFFIPNESPYWKLSFGYWFVSFWVSDYVWNITTILLGTKIPIHYYGTTKNYDKFMTKLGSWGWFAKWVFGAVGTTFLLGIQEYINSLL